MTGVSFTRNVCIPHDRQLHQFKRLEARLCQSRIQVVRRRGEKRAGGMGAESGGETSVTKHRTQASSRILQRYRSSHCTFHHSGGIKKKKKNITHFSSCDSMCKENTHSGGRGAGLARRFVTLRFTRIGD